ncbi:MAG: hypothetical protein ACI92I_000533 [Acidimicrobiales bacterium]|jgi:hypothetical protein
MSNPYESFSHPREEILHPHLQKQADEVGSILKNSINNYNADYIFKANVVTFCFKTEQIEALLHILPELSLYCRNNGLTLTKNEQEIRIGLQKLDIEL